MCLVKSLIIKSAEIVEAYEEELRKTFDGLYTAQSDFGDYQRTTNQTITDNSTATENRFTEHAEIISRLVNYDRDINAWIKTGELEDGVYGIEVGQTTEENGDEVYNKYARFTSGGLYFYIPSVDEPIAYMTDNKLYITNAHIVGSLTLGGYVVDTSNGVAFKWGGSNGI